MIPQKPQSTALTTGKPYVMVGDVQPEQIFVDGRLGKGELTVAKLLSTNLGRAVLNTIGLTRPGHHRWIVTQILTTGSQRQLLGQATVTGWPDEPTVPRFGDTPNKNYGECEFRTLPTPYPVPNKDGVRRVGVIRLHLINLRLKRKALNTYSDIQKQFNKAARKASKAIKLKV